MIYSSKQSNRLYVQICDEYGRICYSYKTQVIMSTMLKRRKRYLEIFQIVLSSISATSLITNIGFNNHMANIIISIITTLSLFISVYLKSANYEYQINANYSTSSKLWLIMEDYISLLTDFHDSNIKYINSRRDSLQRRVNDIYAKAPLTTKRAYRKARRDLKKKEDRYFSINELNNILPPHLRIKTKN